MTTLELRTAFLQEVVAIIEDGEGTVQKALDSLRSLRRAEETVSKEEILDGIATGLREMKARHKANEKGYTLQELIDEL